jgi:ferredoxin-NADP reductase
VLVVEETRALTPAVRSIVLRTEDGAPYDYLAGQWIKLYLGETLDRDYSIASAPSAARPDRIELAVTRVEGGPGSGLLHAIEPGTRLETLGPNGLFVREDAHREAPALYVGTGTGVAPLRAMLEDALRDPASPPQALLFGCRTEDDLLYADELRARASSDPRFVYDATLSRPTDGWSGRRGYVQHHLAELLARPALAEAHVFVCGLTRMIDDVRRVLKEELRLDRRRIHSERYD